MRSRRDYLISAAALAVGKPLSAFQDASSATSQRVVVVMFDGFGLDYYEKSTAPTLHRWQKEGLFKRVQGVMPSVTNANNTSICCGVFPKVHGITGNSYLDTSTGREEYMEDGNLLRAPTLFEHGARKGVSSALLSSKKKSISLLRKGTSFAMTAEEPTPEWVNRLGPPPQIYSREINYWLMRAAIHVLKNRPEIGCLYIHTTDYPMHTWAPEAFESKEHLGRLDALLGEAASVAPDAAFLVTGDHGMHHKQRCWDLAKACRNRQVAVRVAISAERDRYLKHHQGFGGTSWVYLQHHADADRVAAVLLQLTGVEQVLSRADAARAYHLMPDRIGDLAVFGDRDTVFGDLEEETEALPPSYRSHGSRHELDVPLFVYNAAGAPGREFFANNLDLARWLYR